MIFCRSCHLVWSKGGEERENQSQGCWGGKVYLWRKKLCECIWGMNECVSKWEWEVNRDYVERERWQRWVNEETRQREKGKGKRRWKGEESENDKGVVRKKKEGTGKKERKKNWTAACSIASYAGLTDGMWTLLALIRRVKRMCGLWSS